MNDKALREVVQRVILTELAKIGEPYVPVSSSNRHVHLCQADVERLFGTGYRLTSMRDLIQPGQYACNERVTIETEKGRMTLRVVGPARKETQVELSMTDAIKLGLRPPIRMSGDLTASPGCTLVNGERRIVIGQGVIIAARHLHLAPEEAKAFGMKDGDTVSLAVEGSRATTLGNVIVRSGTEHLMEAHIDTDEANACGITDGQLCRVLIPAGGITPPADPRLSGALSSMLKADAPAIQQHASPLPVKAAQSQKPTMLDLSYEPRRLITEDDVHTAAQMGYKLIRYAKDAILTPLARDAASDKGIELVAVV